MGRTLERHYHLRPKNGCLRRGGRGRDFTGNVQLLFVNLASTRLSFWRSLTQDGTSDLLRVHGPEFGAGVDVSRDENLTLRKTHDSVPRDPRLRGVLSV